MVIISDCLTEKIDEGCLKVANSLTERIKRNTPESFIVSYFRKTPKSDLHLELNKMFLNRKLWSLLRKKKQPILYIPFASNTAGSALRTLVLSLFAKTRVRVIFVLRYPMNALTRAILKLSGAQVIALSMESYDYYSSCVDNVQYLKVGVDLKQFAPVSAERKAELRAKYNIESNKKIVLHVGHLKSGRNVDKLLQVDEKYHVFMVASTVTQDERDQELCDALNARPNTTVVETYLDHIEEIYQMADVYFFPVMEEGNCIDVPLSALEAAACNIPIVTTDYGELKAFRGEPGFRFISDFGKEELNRTLEEMASMEGCRNRDAVREYDWDAAVTRLLQDM